MLCPKDYSLLDEENSFLSLEQSYETERLEESESSEESMDSSEGLTSIHPCSFGAPSESESDWSDVSLVIEGRPNTPVSIAELLVPLTGTIPEDQNDPVFPYAYLYLT